MCALSKVSPLLVLSNSGLAFWGTSQIELGDLGVILRDTCCTSLLTKCSGPVVLETTRALPGMLRGACALPLVGTKEVSMDLSKSWEEWVVLVDFHGGQTVSIPGPTYFFWRGHIGNV